MLRRSGKESKPGFCIFMHRLNGTDDRARDWHNLRNAQFSRTRFALFVQGADFEKKAGSPLAEYSVLCYNYSVGTADIQKIRIFIRSLRIENRIRQPSGTYAKEPSG